MSFTARRWKGEDGLNYELVPFSPTVDGTDERKECAKLFRQGLGKTQAAFRLQIDDLGILAMHAREAFMEALGRVSLEVTALDLKEHDAIEGLGEIETLELIGWNEAATKKVIIATITKSGTQVVFTSNEKNEFEQLIDITRDKADDN